MSARHFCLRLRVFSFKRWDTDVNVIPGIDTVLEGGRKASGRIGLVTSSAARTAKGEKAHLALRAAGVRVVRLFSPEHGLGAAVPDGSAVADGEDIETGLPVVSLYGQRVAPDPEMLADLDEVWFDLPDIGARFYTYLWTLYHLQSACAVAGKPLVVLDRPNPIGGGLRMAEGPMLDTRTCASFLGMTKMPIRHSLTMGELGGLWKEESGLALDFQVMPCRGWERWMHWPDTGLTFHPTSPAMRSYESALLYPGLCLFEATNVSVGRGTSQPFQLIAAPWLEPQPVIELIAATFPQACFSRAQCEPEASVHAGMECQAIRIRPTEPRALRPVALGLSLLAAVIHVHPDHFEWASYPTAANPSGTRHFEFLVGREKVTMADYPKAKQEIPQLTVARGWAERVAPFLKY